MIRDNATHPQSQYNPNQVDCRPKNIKNLFTLITTIIILIIGVLGYLLISRISKSTTSVHRSSSNPKIPITYQPISTLTSIVSNEWNIYTNTKHKYSLEYPKNWFIYGRDLYKQGKTINELEREDYIFITPYKTTPGAGGRLAGVNIEVENIATNLTSVEYAQRYIIPKHQIEAEEHMLHLESMHLQNIDAAIISGFLTGDGPELYVIHNNIGIDMTTFIDSRDEGTIQHIFTSIKFIN